MRLLLLLIFILIVPSIAVGRISNDLGMGTTPVKEQLKGFTEAYCSELSGNYKVGGAIAEDYSRYTIIYRSDVEILRIAHGTDSIPTSEFFAYRYDLDKDGTKEVVVASLRTITNGMGVARWDLNILADSGPPSKNGRVKFLVEGFGPRQTLTVDRTSGRMRFLITYWRSSCVLDPKRGCGLYFVGKFFEYKDGKLVPIWTEPTRARRYLFSFRDERNRTYSFEGGDTTAVPLTWLRSKATHRYFSEPKRKDAELISTLKGTIQDYAFDQDTDEARLSILTDNGQVLKGCIIGSEYDDGKDLDFIGNQVILHRGNYAFPEHFDISQTLGDLKGRSVRIETYKNEFEITSSTLRLLSK